MFVIASLSRPPPPAHRCKEGWTKDMFSFFVYYISVLTTVHTRVCMCSVLCLFIADTWCPSMLQLHHKPFAFHSRGLTSIANTPLYERPVMFLKYVGVRAPCTRLFDSIQTSAAQTAFSLAGKKMVKGQKRKLQPYSADEGIEQVQ